MTQVKQEWI